MTFCLFETASSVTNLTVVLINLQIFHWGLSIQLHSSNKGSKCNIFNWNQPTSNCLVICELITEKLLHYFQKLAFFLDNSQFFGILQKCVQSLILMRQIPFKTRIALFWLLFLPVFTEFKYRNRIQKNQAITAKKT